MTESDGIKIRITSDSDPALKGLQKIEQKAKAALDKASAAADKTGSRIAALQARMDEIARGKAANLDIGLKWDEGQFDSAIQKSLELDAEYRRLAASAARLTPQFEQQKQKTVQLGAAHEQAAQKIVDHEGGTRRMNTLAGKARGLFTALAKRLGALKTNTGKATKETQKHTRAMKQNTKAADPLSKALKRVGTAIKSMLLYAVVRGIFNSVKEGFADLAKYSDATNDALSRLSTAFLYVRNAVTAVCKPVLEALAPVIESVADWFARAANSAAAFTTALFGNGNTYTQATKAAKKYGDETEKAAKKTERALASFDDINQISIGEQEEVEAPTPDDMFEEAPIDKEVQGLADKVKAFFEQLKSDAGEIWSVFQQSWTQAGQTTVDAAKSALSGIMEALGAIGGSFKEVWTNGTGVTVLNYIQGLLQVILGIVGSIALAFTAAWATGDAGTHLMQVLADAVNYVVLMVTAIGQAFMDAWNAGGLGQSILSHIISIVTGIVGIVGQIAGRFTEAWNAGGNGQAVMTAVLGIVDSILGTIDGIIQATLLWTSGLNLEPLMTSIRLLLEAIKPVVDVIGQVLKDMWISTVFPFLTWLLQSALPGIINALGSLFQYLSENPELLKTITQLVVAFVAAWNIAKPIGDIINFVGGLTKLKVMAMLVVGVLTILGGLILSVAEAWNNMSGLEKAISVLGLLAVAAATVAVALHAITGIAGALLAAGAIVGGIALVTAAINSANSRAKSTSASSTGGSMSYAASGYSLRSAPIPALATGAVIPPNNEFLAVLGDQRRGTNIETPESLLRQIVREEGGGNEKTVKVDVVFSGSLAQLGRLLNPIIKVDERRLGPSLVK